MPKAVHAAGLIKKQKDITGDLNDSPSQQNALLINRTHFANAILVGQDGSSTGAVKLRFEDGTTDTIPYLTPGIWHNMEPFDHVFFTGSTADSVRVGVTW